MICTASSPIHFFLHLMFLLDSRFYTIFFFPKAGEKKCHVNTSAVILKKKKN